MKKDFRFESSTRDGIAYAWESNYSMHDNGFFRQPSRCIAPEVNEFQTHNDGMIQHGPLYAVSAENIQDFLVSLLIFLKDCHGNSELEAVSGRWPHDRISRDRVKFYEGLRYDPGKHRQTLYNNETMGKSNVESRWYDKRWQEIPSYADGSFMAVFRFSVENHFSALERYSLYQNIRQIMGCPWIDENDLKDWIGFDISTKENRHVRPAYSALDDLIAGYRYTDGGLRQLDCLMRNMGLHEDSESEVTI